MSRIDVQKFSNGAPPSGGKLFIGTYLSNEPEVNTITVYTDAALTAGISIISGVDLDQDGYPLINGVRTNLYVGVNYSLQILDRNNAPFFPEAFQETVTEQAAGSVSTFTQLSDVPSNYAGDQGKVATVNATEDGLEFTTPAAGGGFNTINIFDPVAQTTANFTGIAGHFYSVSTDEVSAVVASPEASPVGGDQVFIRSSGQGALNFAPDISAFSGLTMVVGTDVCLTYLSGLNAWQKTSEF